MDEFTLIQRFFSKIFVPSYHHKHSGVKTGIGDDAAIVCAPDGYELVSCIDTLVGDVHFPKSADAGDIASRCFLTNLSDIAAMGAEPKWFSLTLTLPEADTHWLSSFSDELQRLSQQYGMYLIGGDTTKGPLNIAIHMLGIIPTGKGILRSGAQENDDIWLTGNLGCAALALNEQLPWNPDNLDERNQYLLNCYWRPDIPLSFMLRSRDWINSAIDISDGLVQDVLHICTSSNVSATIHIDQIPISEAASWIAMNSVTDYDQLQLHSISMGDSYQMCFTAAEVKAKKVQSIAQQLNTKLSWIGKINPGQGNLMMQFHGKSVKLPTNRGFDHFQPLEQSC